MDEVHSTSVERAIETPTQFALDWNSVPSDRKRPLPETPTRSSTHLEVGRPRNLEIPLALRFAAASSGAETPDPLPAMSELPSPSELPAIPYLSPPGNRITTFRPVVLPNSNPLSALKLNRALVTAAAQQVSTGRSSSFTSNAPTNSLSATFWPTARGFSDPNFSTFFEDFRVVRTLGSGSSTRSVHLAVHKIDGVLYAVKEGRQPIRSAMQMFVLQLLSFSHFPSGIMRYVKCIVSLRYLITRISFATATHGSNLQFSIPNWNTVLGVHCQNI